MTSGRENPSEMAGFPGAWNITKHKLRCISETEPLYQVNGFRFHWKRSFKVSCYPDCDMTTPCTNELKVYSGNSVNMGVNTHTHNTQFNPGLIGLRLFWTSKQNTVCL